MARDRMLLTIGLRLDVLDNEGIWNTGRVMDVAKDDDKDDELAEIKYDGWGDEYNEWVAVSEQRLAPLHMFTIVKKCWAKLNKWPWWPAFVVLRAPTKRGAVEALAAETKVYVEFFDSFEEDKRSRCWMQRKSVVSFDDAFEERAAKNVGKSFHKFVESTQRALASSSPLLFVGSGTLPIEYSSKSPLALVAHKQKLGEKEWFAAYKAFSDRYAELYGFGAAKSGGAAKPSGGKKTRTSVATAADDDAEVAGDNGDESDEIEEAEGEEASAGEEEEEEEAAESARGRRSGRAAPPQKRKLPTRASTRRNAQKRELERSRPASSLARGARRAVGSEGSRVSPRAATTTATTRLATTTTDETEAPETPIVLTLEDDDDDDDAAPAATDRTAPLSARSVGSTNDAATGTSSGAEYAQPSPTSHSCSSPVAQPPPSLEDWTTASSSQIYLISESPEPFSPPPVAADATTRDAGTPIRKPHAVAGSPSTPLHRRKAPRVGSFVLDLNDTGREGGLQHHATAADSVAVPVTGLDARADGGADAHFWTGGSRYEVENAPWKIMSWLMHGLKQKLLQQEQS
ncbi:hypothetical protein PybrP1_008872 [[Pythium] brassicae (nom. inval.)]|nr:hypothetical protein PybrP1_008872 [[Pythium] brassicae (nom. inval.)]